MRDLFLAFLESHDDAAWLRALERIEPSVHPVDRAATRIWFHFYPLALDRLMRRPDAADLARRMTLAGRWRLSDQIDDSHRFLFGHRYWPQAREVVLAYASGPSGPGSLDLGAQIQEVAALLAARTQTRTAEVTGIAAVALRTLQQVGAEALAASGGTTSSTVRAHWQSADEILAARARQQRKSIWRAFQAGADRSDVTFDEHDVTARFPIIHSQHLTTAAALDPRDFRARDPRCSEGPIPVHCRSCSCGTCWVGILSGGDRLLPMEERERAKLAECGVSVDGDSPIRLACMTQAAGPVSIVIPPWNGLLGRVLSRLSPEISPRR